MAVVAVAALVVVVAGLVVVTGPGLIVFFGLLMGVVAFVGGLPVPLVVEVDVET
jgi:hypothetical protein